MTSHIIVSALDPHRPATFSRTVIGVLRDDLGFDGVVVSDALDMAGASADTGIPEAAVRALVAGRRPALPRLGHLAGDLRRGARRRRGGRAVRAAARGPGGRGRRPGAHPRGDDGAADAGAPASAPTPRPRPCPTRPSAGAFRVGEPARAWLAASGPVALVQVDSTANLAVGGVSWGPAALGATVTEAEVPAGARVAVVGRAVGAGHPASAVVERLRGAGHDVVLVECGWPRGGADIETFGGSPAVARALVGLLRGEVGP